MNMIKLFLRFIVFLTLIFISCKSYSQKSKLKFSYESCTCKGVFDSTKYSREQLQNTFDFLWWAPYINTTATAWTLDKVKSLSIDELNKECEEKLRILNSLDFVDNEFWIKIKNDRIKEIIGTCELRKYTILAFSNPDTLLFYDNIDSTCIFYRDALIEGGQKMIDAWIKLNEIQKGENGYPENVQRKFDEKYNSTHRLEYARLELMMFGWWNNANHLIFHMDYSIRYDLEFEKLFLKVKCDCDEY